MCACPGWQHSLSPGVYVLTSLCLVVRLRQRPQLDKQPAEKSWLGTRGRARSRPLSRPFPVSLLETAEEDASSVPECRTANTGRHKTLIHIIPSICMHTNSPTGVHFLIPPSVYLHVVPFVCLEDCLPFQRWPVRITVKVAPRKHIGGSTHRVVHKHICMKTSSSVSQPLVTFLFPPLPLLLPPPTGNLLYILTVVGVCLCAGAVNDPNTKQVYTLFSIRALLEMQGWIKHASEITLSTCMEMKRKTKPQRSEVRYVESAVNYAGLIFSLSSLSLWCPLSNCTCWIWMYYCLFPPIASLRPVPPPPDCNRSSSLLPLSMQARLHAVHSLSAIRKCHRLLFFQKDRKLNGTEKNWRLTGGK